MTELVKRNVDGWSEVLPAVGDLSSKIASTDFVPEAMRGKPAMVAAAILYGRELGMEPMTSLRSINVIKGKPSLSSESMRALVLSAGHDIRFVEMTATRCIIEGRRKGQDEPTRVTYTMDDAKKAQLAGQSQYSKMPRQMLAARATAELCRLIFADVIGGLIAAEEVEDTEADTPAPTTSMQRKKPTKVLPETVEVIEEPVVEAVIEEPIEPVEDVVEAEVVDAEVVEEPVVLPPGALRLREAFNETKKPKEARQVSVEQMGRIMATFNEIGIKDRIQRLTISRALAGRETLESAKDLSMSEASAVIDGLEILKAAPDREATIAGLLS